MNPWIIGPIATAPASSLIGFHMLYLQYSSQESIKILYAQLFNYQAFLSLKLLGRIAAYHTEIGPTDRQQIGAILLLTSFQWRTY